MVEQLNDNAVEMLKSDHARIERFYERFRKEEDYEARQEIADDILSDLTAHSAAEEQVFYPELMRAGSDQIQEMLEHSQDEHNEMKELIAEIRAMNFESGYDYLMEKLVQTVMDHVEEEEGVIFPEAEVVLRDKLKTMAAKMMAVKLTVLTREKIKEMGR